MIGLFTPSSERAVASQEGANTLTDLTRVAAALAASRAEGGQFPEKLDDLLPGVLTTLPRDSFNTNPFVYKRDGAGYSLYSVGPNGADEAGSNERSRIFECRRVDDLNATAADSLLKRIPTGADDHSIRVPRPAFELPKLPAAGE